ncbi:hypothetical protein B296_00020921 [Ensete ventricosum]|uniref:Uncharacterized protein n=1 Tax=Ensete ventricosum TaxID=4639 RepID=A0A426XLL7_ENSVE|nr:hypothetical protein B296_00020921 [Ensete ventricosum]
MLVGDRGPGSRQWYTNSSQVRGLQKLLGDGLSWSYASSRCDPKVGGRRDKIMQRYDKELLGASLWCTTRQEEGLWIRGVNSVVLQRRVFCVCASKLTSDESLGHQHMGAMYHRGRSQIVSTSESHGGDLIIQRCKTTDSRAMGLATPCYHKGGTFVESSIPCSHGGRALVVKGTEEVENAKANSKY